MVIWVKILIVVIALLHLYFLWLEMFVWTTKAKKVFRSLPEDLFEKTKVLAANQGLYNGFLASCLATSCLSNKPNPINSHSIIFPTSS